MKLYFLYMVWDSLGCFCVKGSKSKDIMVVMNFELT